LKSNYLDFFRCESCSTGEYSFADGMTAQGCLKCPNNADLCYGAIIDVSAGIAYDLTWKNKIILEVFGDIH